MCSKDESNLILLHKGQKIIGMRKMEWWNNETTFSKCPVHTILQTKIGQPIIFSIFVRFTKIELNQV